MKPRIWRQHGAWWCALQVEGATPAGYGSTPLEAFAAWLWWASHGGATLLTADGAAPSVQ